MVHATAVVDCPSAHRPIGPSYAELHCHSAYSFLDGASPPDEILAEAHRLGYPALALTDRNGIYGSLAFAHAAQPLGIQAITGAEVILTDGTQLVLLAESARGYASGHPTSSPYSSLNFKHRVLLAVARAQDSPRPPA